MILTKKQWKSIENQTFLIKYNLKHLTWLMVPVPTAVVVVVVVFDDDHDDDDDDDDDDVTWREASILKKSLISLGRGQGNLRIWAHVVALPSCAEGQLSKKQWNP